MHTFSPGDTRGPLYSRGALPRANGEVPGKVSCVLVASDALSGAAGSSMSVCVCVSWRREARGAPRLLILRIYSLTSIHAVQVQPLSPCHACFPEVRQKQRGTGRTVLYHAIPYCAIPNYTKPYCRANYTMPYLYQTRTVYTMPYYTALGVVHEASSPPAVFSASIHSSEREPPGLFDAADGAGPRFAGWHAGGLRACGAIWRPGDPRCLVPVLVRATPLDLPRADEISKSRLCTFRLMNISCSVITRDGTGISYSL